MIIFGSRTTSALVAALVFACALCHATAAQRLFRRRTWFTLFFLPIFPFGHGRYVLQCSYCGQTQNLDRDTAERFKADAERTQQRLHAHDTLPAAPTGGDPASAAAVSGTLPPPPSSPFAGR